MLTLHSNVTFKAVFLQFLFPPYPHFMAGLNGSHVRRSRNVTVTVALAQLEDRRYLPLRRDNHFQAVLSTGEIATHLLGARNDK